MLNSALVVVVGGWGSHTLTNAIAWQGLLAMVLRAVRSIRAVAEEEKSSVIYY